MDPATPEKGTRLLAKALCPPDPESLRPLLPVSQGYKTFLVNTQGHTAITKVNVRIFHHNPETRSVCTHCSPHRQPQGAASPLSVHKGLSVWTFHESAAQGVSVVTGFFHLA